MLFSNSEKVPRRNVILFFLHAAKWRRACELHARGSSKNTIASRCWIPKCLQPACARGQILGAHSSIVRYEFVGCKFGATPSFVNVRRHEMNLFCTTKSDGRIFFIHALAYNQRCRSGESGHMSRTSLRRRVSILFFFERFNGVEISKTQSNLPERSRAPHAMDPKMSFEI